MKRTLLLSISLCVILISISANASLVAHYEFSGNANDSVGSHHGSFLGDATTIYDSEMGQVLSTSNGGYVSIPDSHDFRFEGSFSLAAWFKTTDTAKGAIMRFNRPAYSIQIYLNQSNAGDLYIYVEPEHIVYDDTLVNNGVWHHVAITVDGDDSTNNYDLYVDGEWAGRDTVRAYYDRWDWITIGAANGSDPFTGSIDDVRIYNHPLSTEEVGQLYTIPEPATLLLLGMGAVLIRKRK